MTSDLLEKENEELKTDNKVLREKVHWWKKEVNVAHRARADEFENIMIENKVLKSKLAEAIDLLNFWVEDFYDGFNHSNCYEVRHNVLVKIEQFIKENK